MKNKRAPVLTADVAKPKRGGGRALRSQKRKAYYAAGPARVAANKRRKILKHERDCAQKEVKLARRRRRIAHKAVAI
jgi:hypothetical protein